MRIEIQFRRVSQLLLSVQTAQLLPPSFYFERYLAAVYGTGWKIRKSMKKHCSKDSTESVIKESYGPWIFWRPQPIGTVPRMPVFIRHWLPDSFVIFRLQLFPLLLGSLLLSEAWHVGIRQQSSIEWPPCFPMSWSCQSELWHTSAHEKARERLWKLSSIGFFDFILAFGWGGRLVIRKNYGRRQLQEKDAWENLCSAIKPRVNS